MYSSDSGFDASRTELARRRTASFTICTISPSIFIHSSRFGWKSTVPARSREALGIWRGSYAASWIAGSEKRREVAIESGAA